MPGYQSISNVSAWAIFEYSQNREGGPLPEKVTEAVEFVIRSLLNGPMKVNDFNAKAEEDGVRPRTLERARKVMTEKGRLRARWGEPAKSEDAKARYVELVLPDVPDFPPEA